MRILLINPPNLNPVASVLPEALEKERGHNPPLGLLYIAGYLKAQKGNYDVRLIDSPTENLDYSQLSEKIRDFNPEIAGITTMSFTIIDALKTAALVKKINPAIKVVFGGVHVHIYGKETLDLGNSDFIVLGEGEKTFHQLVENIGSEEKLKEIPGLIFYDKEGTLVRTPPSEFIENLDELPFPARDLIDNKKYFSALGANRQVTTMITSRGCPFRCLFCDRPQLGKRFRARSPKNVADEMEQCLKNYGIKEFLVYDDTITVQRQRVIDICDEIIRRKLNIVWDIRARVDTIDEALLSALKKAGCARIHYGVESGTQKVLDIFQKGITLEQAERVFKLTKKAGIQTLGYFMIGNPTETKEDVLKTISFAKKLSADYVHITTTIPYPDTKLYFLALQEGIIEKDVWLEFAKNPSLSFVPPVWDKNLSRQDLHNLMKMAYKEFYFRPSYLLKRILTLRSFGELQRKIKGGLKIFNI